MRLIDADKLIEHLTVDGYIPEVVKSTIDRQPTAYEPKKVEKQLIEMYKTYFGVQWDLAPHLIKTIYLIRKGGKD